MEINETTGISNVLDEICEFTERKGDKLIQYVNSLRLKDFWMLLVALFNISQEK